MIYSELIYDDKSIFTFLEEKGYLPFSSSLVSSDEMNEVFTFLNGRREVAKTLEENFKVDEEKSLSIIANVIGMKFSKKWKLSFDSLELDYDSLGNEKISETNVDNVNDVNKVSSYDSEELIDDTSIVKEHKQVKEKEILKNDVKSKLDMIERLQDVLIYDIIFTDVRTTILKNII